MKIGIDISQIVYPGTGVGTYVRNLVENLLQIDADDDFVLFGSSLRQKEALLSAVKGFSLRNETHVDQKIFSLPPFALDLLWNRWHTLSIEKLIGDVDVFHASDWTQPPTGRAKKITTVFDMVVYRYPQTSHDRTELRADNYSLAANIVATQKRRLSWVQKETDLVLTISEASKRDIADILQIPPEKIKVVYLAAGSEFKPQSPGEIKRVREKYRLDRNYILAVGTREPRKNLDRVVKAFKQLSLKDTLLAIAGKAGWGGRLNNPINQSANKQIKFLDYVPQGDLPALYGGAKVFVYPSLFEGFGVPVLEAMACGVPVITSNTGSLPEVGGSAAFYVSPEDVSDIAAKTFQVLHFNTSVYRSAREKGINQAKKFSWKKTAAETLSAYRRLANN